MPQLIKDLEALLFMANNRSRKLVTAINDYMQMFQPLEIIILTLALAIVLRYFGDRLAAIRLVGIKTTVFRVAAKLPFVSGYLKNEGDKILSQYKEQYKKQRPNSIAVLPPKGLPMD
jgi:hypothetical protein